MNYILCYFFSGNSCLAWVDMVALVILRMSPLSLFQVANFSFGGFLLELWLASLIYSNLDLIFWLITIIQCIPADKSVEHSVILHFIPIVLKASLGLLMLFSQFSVFSGALWRNTHSCRIVLITIIHCKKKRVLTAKSVLPFLSCL